MTRVRGEHTIMRDKYDPIYLRFPTLVGNLSVFVLSFLIILYSLLRFPTLVGNLSVFVLSFLIILYSLFFFFIFHITVHP